jgi:hypothetical protein
VEGRAGTGFVSEGNSVAAWPASTPNWRAMPIWSQTFQLSTITPSCTRHADIPMSFSRLRVGGVCELLTGVGASYGPSCECRVTLLDDLVDSDLQIGKGRAHGAVKLLELF